MVRAVLSTAIAVAATLAAVAPAGASTSPQRGATAAANPFPHGQVTFAGHGWGPALGMGQWGAFGYAARYHRSYTWILSHFYGGTTLAHIHNPMVSVAITENLGDPVVVTSESGWRFGGVRIPAGDAGKAVLDPATDRWQISEAPSCSSTGSAWTTIATNLNDPLAIPASRAPTAPASDLLTICRADRVAMTVRGVVEAYDEGGGMRTLNLLRLEQYVADVTPSESSAGWARYGGSGPQGEQWGFQSLEAQAVAARTFVLAYESGGGWYGYADICDTGCQSYPGIVNESPLATLATEDTAGQILETSVERPAPTEYSASTGGYTVNDSTWAGTTPFAQVPDAGDAVCIQSSGWTCNTLHSWTSSVPVTEIESTWPGIGRLRSVTVVSRYGSPRSAYGGRADTIEVEGSKGTETLLGYQWASDFGMWSDWFAVTDGPGATAPPPHAEPTGASDGAARSGGSSFKPASGLFQPTGPLP